MGKEDWKQTGKELGGAFTGLAKTFVRSAKRSVDKVEEWAEGNEQPKEQPESTVFSDGSWKETGKDLGNALKGLGQSRLISASIHDFRAINGGSSTGSRGINMHT